MSKAKRKKELEEIVYCVWACYIDACNADIDEIDFEPLRKKLKKLIDTAELRALEKTKYGALFLMHAERHLSDDVLKFATDHNKYIDKLIKELKTQKESKE